MAAVPVNAAVIAEKCAAKTIHTAENAEPVPLRKKGIYERYIKTAADAVCAAAITAVAPLRADTAPAVKAEPGSPVLFTQERPGMIDEKRAGKFLLRTGRIGGEKYDKKQKPEKDIIAGHIGV